MNETRVNLRHLLEDLRDGYALPIEEVIVTELIANSLDSKASSVSFFARPHDRSLICVDNGTGMKRNELRDYHDIAATTKERGHGIGFAGVGAKLSLLVRGIRGYGNERSSSLSMRDNLASCAGYPRSMEIYSFLRAHSVASRHSRLDHSGESQFAHP